MKFFVLIALFFSALAFAPATFAQETTVKSKKSVSAKQTNQTQGAKYTTLQDSFESLVARFMELKSEVEKIVACGEQAKLYGPDHADANSNGCVDVMLP